MTPAQREAWLIARGWVKGEGCWRLAARERVYQVSSAAAALAVQERRDAARRSPGHRAAPGSGL